MVREVVACRTHGPSWVSINTIAVHDHPQITFGRRSLTSVSLMPCSYNVGRCRLGLALHL